MGGKGVRRREKNYRAAHGGDARLPPPPDASKHDAVPSKLRQLMKFASTSHDGGADKLANPAEDSQGKDKRRKGNGGNEARQVAITSRNDEQGNSDNGDDGVEAGKGKKKSKKRKRNQVKDLRFETLVGTTKTKEKRKERTKKYLEAKKKKQHKSGAAQQTADFPEKDHVKFGDVVQAPPKLNAIPKGAKKAIEASQERIRLQAIEAYRKRKAWTSRPGLQLPSAAATTM